MSFDNDERPDEAREANPHVVFGSAHYCPARGWTYFLTVEGRCPGCGAEVRHPGLEAQTPMEE